MRDRGSLVSCHAPVNELVSMVEVPSILIRSVNCAIAATWSKRHIQFAAPCRRFADHRRIRIGFGGTVRMRGKHLLRQAIKSGDNRDSSCFGPR